MLSRTHLRKQWKVRRTTAASIALAHCVAVVTSIALAHWVAVVSSFQDTHKEPQPHRFSNIKSK